IQLVLPANDTDTAAAGGTLNTAGRDATVFRGNALFAGVPRTVQRTPQCRAARTLPQNEPFPIAANKLTPSARRVLRAFRFATHSGSASSWRIRSSAVILSSFATDFLHKASEPVDYTAPC